MDVYLYTLFLTLLYIVLNFYKYDFMELKFTESNNSIFSGTGCLKKIQANSDFCVHAYMICIASQILMNLDYRY